MAEEKGRRVVKRPQHRKRPRHRDASARTVVRIEGVEFRGYYKTAAMGILRSMFSFLEKRGVIGKSPAAPIDAVRPEASHVQGPYTDAQVDRIMASIDKSVPFNLPLAKRPTYAPRIRTFINLLLQTGCDVSDAVLHEPSRVEAHKVSGRTIHEYRYKRTKTGVEAVIPISGKLAVDLKSVTFL